VNRVVNEVGKKWKMGWKLWNIGSGKTYGNWGYSIDKSHPKFDVNFLSNLGKN